MPIRTNEFQRLIAVIQSHLDPGSTVTESAMLEDASSTGTRREVDVVVSGRVGGQAVTVSIECRDRRRRPDVTWVEGMHAKHSRLPTNVLVLVSHKNFTPEAGRIARLYGIRCLVLDDVDPAAPDRLFPDVRSLWGKAWEIGIDRVEVSVGALGELPPERFRALPDNDLFLDDGTEVGSAVQLVSALVRSQQVIDKMARDAQPEHHFLELVWDRPMAQERAICVQKRQPLVLRPIEQFRVVEDLPENGRESEWRCCSRDEGDEIFRAIRIELGPDGFRLGLQEGIDASLQLVKVLAGPIEFGLTIP